MERRLPAWARELKPSPGNPKPENGVTGQRVDASVPERTIGPAPSITGAEIADRHGMAYLSNRGKLDGRP